MTRYYKYNNGDYKDVLNKNVRKKAGKCLVCGEVAKEIETTRWTKTNNQLKLTKVKSTNLEVHHIDGDKTNNNENNLTVLCKSCHHKYGHINIREGNRIKSRIPNMLYQFESVSDMEKALI